MIVFRKAKALYDHFFQPLTEGHYRAEPTPLWRLFMPSKKTQQIPDVPHLNMGTKMLDTSKMIGKRFMWGAIYALLAVKTVTLAAAALAVAGGGLFGLEYYRSRKAGKEVITEVNFAGQTVEGSRASLCRLYQAQIRIMNLTTHFKRASLESTRDTIQRIVDRGRYGARRDAYEFSEPGIKLVGDIDGLMTPLRNVSVEAAPKSKLSDMSLKPDWTGAAFREDEVLARLSALYDVLPDHMLDRLNEMTAERQARAIKKPVAVVIDGPEAETAPKKAPVMKIAAA